MPDTLEVHLEEVARHARGVKEGFRAFLAGGGVGGWGGNPQRFVARPPGPDESPADHVLGPTFPVMGGEKDLSSQHRPNSFIELAEQGLAELDRQLVQDGWVRQADVGPYWWSRSYTRSPS